MWNKYVIIWALCLCCSWVDVDLWLCNINNIYTTFIAYKATGKISPVRYVEPCISSWIMVHLQKHCVHEGISWGTLILSFFRSLRAHSTQFLHRQHSPVFKGKICPHTVGCWPVDYDLHRVCNGGQYAAALHSEMRSMYSLPSQPHCSHPVTFPFSSVSLPDQHSCRPSRVGLWIMDQGSWIKDHG